MSDSRKKVTAAKVNSEPNPHEVKERPSRKQAKPAPKVEEPTIDKKADEVEVMEPEPQRRQIESLDDAKAEFWDTVERFKESSAEEVKDGILKLGNSLFRRVRRALDD